MSTDAVEGGEIVRAKCRTNPYAYMFSDSELDQLLLDLGRRRAASIRRNRTEAGSVPSRGVYPEPGMGFVIMDPTADPWVPHDAAVLGVVTVGADGHRWLVNAAAKAAGHRRLGRNYGEAVLTDPHLCGSGAFRWGHSVEVRGVIVGASSQTSDQDAFESTHLASEFVAAVTARHLAWEQQAKGEDWLSPHDLPAPEFRNMVAEFLPTD
ncbi:hypothetical protein [Streptomyces sp. NPDC056144]|uniref:hypothetical protein n=1 Tax=unclassified Streptomyces TaxID=2593676 RepID=UPI0035D68332